MSDSNRERKATPDAVLRRTLLDPNYPKGEMEWYASRRIKQLEEELNLLATEGVVHLGRWRLDDWPALDADEGEAMDKLGPNKDYDMWYVLKLLTQAGKITNA